MEFNGFSMDGRTNRRKKAAFLNFPVVVRTHLNKLL